MAQQQTVERGMVVSLQYSLHVDEELVESTETTARLNFCKAIRRLSLGWSRP